MSFNNFNSISNETSAFFYLGLENELLFLKILVLLRTSTETV